jgi:hypothetical protein
MDQARHLPPEAATRHPKWDDDWVDEGGQMADFLNQHPNLNTRTRYPMAET